MANPPNESEERVRSYLETHGYIAEHDLDWRERFPEVETTKNPDFLVSRAGEVLAICEVKQWESSRVDKRLAVHRSGSFSSEEMHKSAADAVQDASREQLRPFADVGLPLVVVVANPLHCFVPLGREDIARSLFYFRTSKQTLAGSDGLVRPIDVGALAEADENGVIFNPHPHLSAVVVLHERTREQDFFDDERAAMRSPEPPRTESELHERATSMLVAFNEARREGRIPPGSYEWAEVFDLSGLGTFNGTPLPDNLFDGPRDRWYVIGEHGFIERTTHERVA